MQALVEVFVRAATTAPVEPDPEIVTPGMLGLAMILALGIAVVFLYKSMNRQLKRVDFPEPDGSAEAADGRPQRSQDDDSSPASQ